MVERDLLAACAAAFLASSCAWNGPTTPLRGDLAGQPLETTVDAPIASYYVEHYLARAGHRADWDASLDEIHRRLGERLPSSAELRDWSRSYSTDLAALILARQLLRQAEKQPLHLLFREELAMVSRARETGTLDTIAIDPAFVIAFVPGWLYKTDPATGADFGHFRELLRAHGARVALIETGENLPVEENANLIELEVRRLHEAGRPVILVSSSKGGPETAQALSRLRDHPAGRNVKAWLNIGGLLRGTPLADVGLTWPACWFVYLAVLPDGSFEGIRSVSTARSAARLQSLELPPHTLVVNYLGIPLSGQVSGRARDGYSLLRAEGPNDGLIYLLDGIAPHGVTIPELGADHYFRSSDIDLKTVALARALTRYLRQGDGRQRVAELSGGR